MKNVFLAELSPSSWAVDSTPFPPPTQPFLLFNNHFFSVPPFTFPCSLLYVNLLQSHTLEETNKNTKPESLLLKSSLFLRGVSGKFSIFFVLIFLRSFSLQPGSRFNLPLHWNCLDQGDRWSPELHELAVTFEVFTRKFLSAFHTWLLLIHWFSNSMTSIINTAFRFSSYRSVQCCSLSCVGSTLSAWALNASTSPSPAATYFSHTLYTLPTRKHLHPIDCYLTCQCLHPDSRFELQIYICNLYIAYSKFERIDMPYNHCEHILFYVPNLFPIQGSISPGTIPPPTQVLLSPSWHHSHPVCNFL